MNSNKTAVVLAGGRSRRFGRDKAWALYEGKTLIEIVIERLKSAHCDVILSGSDPRLKQLSFPVIEDEHPFEGPLQALKGIWEKTSNSRILLVACDMPFLSPDVIQTLWTTDSHSDIVLLQGEEGPSPLPGVYDRTTYPFVTSLIEKGRKDLKALWNRDLAVSVVTRQLLHRLDPLGKSLWNINTPQDLSFLVE
ncbi:MAG: molybdenum cofactor guanylyltransferase [Deltaproteobacteria bacterium]|nr:molybdenum cofactor guanylyltransferase [Deltaproteobacteria bacterium]